MLFTLVLVACTTGPASDPSDAALPALCGDLVDAEGAPLANSSFCINLIEGNGTSGGRMAASDQSGEFRIDGLARLRLASDSQRTLVLVGSGSQEARVDVSRAFGPGVHHLGEVVMADPCDARAMRRLSDVALLSALERARTISGREVDTCLRECARRRTVAVREYLAAEASRGSSPTAVWRTAECRADGLCDPIGLELAGSAGPREFRCRLGELPTVELRFVNRDPKGRAFDLQIHDGGDPNLAVDCVGDAAQRGRVRLVSRLPRDDETFIGGWFYSTQSIAPGAAVTVRVRLGDLIEVGAPGEYHLRFAWRGDGYERFVDEQRNELMSGYLLLYSEPFMLIVGEP